MGSVSNAEELYTYVTLNMDELIENKKTILAEMLSNIMYLNLSFPNSKYLSDAVNYFFFYYMRFFNQLQEEHDVYIDIQDYIETYKYLSDLTNEDILINLNYILDLLDTAFERRMINYSNFSSFVDKLLIAPALTNSNYMYMNITDSLLDEDREEIRELMPKR